MQVQWNIPLKLEIILGLTQIYALIIPNMAIDKDNQEITQSHRKLCSVRAAPFIAKTKML